jgi:hypothetical protein
MTLLVDLLSEGIPTYETAKQFALVFGQEPYLALQATGAQHPNSQHRVSARQLTDGRWMLNADLLTEIGNGGLYSEGFGSLDPALFELVEVFPIQDALALLPIETLPLEPDIL